MVFVRGAENLEFANPSTISNRYSTFAAQGTEIYGDPFELCAGKKSDAHPMRHLVNFGEDVKSLRTLLRRSSLSVIMRPTTFAANRIGLWRYRFSKYPTMPGYDPNGIFQAVGIVVAANFTYNWSFMTPYNWVSAAFAAQRGSMIWTFATDQNGTPSVGDTIRVYRDVGTSGAANVSAFISGTPASLNQYAAWSAANMQPGSGGQTLTLFRTNAGLQVSLPNYTRFRYMSTIPTNASTLASVDGQDIDAYALEIYANQSNLLANISIQMHEGAGTDFGLYYFINVPTFYWYGTQPVAP